MIETVFALILTLNGNMIEHVYKPSLSDCLKSKRIAQNEVNPERVVFTCKKVKAQTEIYLITFLAIRSIIIHLPAIIF